MSKKIKKDQLTKLVLLCSHSTSPVGGAVHPVVRFILLGKSCLHPSQNLIPEPEFFIMMSALFLKEHPVFLNLRDLRDARNKTSFISSLQC